MKIDHQAGATPPKKRDDVQLVAQFERLGILREVTGQSRNRRYHYKPYLDLFGELRP